MTLSVIQPLLRGAGEDVTTAPLRQARLTEEVNRLNLKVRISQVIVQVAYAWRRLLQSQEQLEIARASLARSQDQMRINGQLIRAGKLAELDRYQAEADEASQALGVQDAENQLDNDRLALLRILNLNLNTPLRTTSQPDAFPVSISPDKAYKAALEHEPNYLKQLIAGQSAALNLVVAQNSQLWDVSLNAGIRQFNDRPGTEHWQGYGGVSVTIPVGILSQRQSLVQAQVNVRQQDYNLIDALNRPGDPGD